MLRSFEKIVIVSDCDCTLLNSERELPDENVTAIRYFVEHGGHFVLATGRPRNGAKHILAKLPATPDPSVFFNGALICEGNGGRVLYRDVLPVNAQDIFFNVINRFGLLAGVEAFTEDEAVILQDHYYTDIHFKALHEEKKIVDAGCLEGKSLLKMFVTGEEKTVLSAWEYLSSLYGDRLHIVPSSPNFLEIFSITSGKDVALKFLRSYFTEANRFIAVGDSYNDIPMIQCADSAYCPSNSVDDVKKLAKVMCSNDEGVFKDIIQDLTDNG